MITRPKDGIHKPKIYNVNNTQDINLASTVFEPLNNQNWRQAMEEEFNTLIGPNQSLTVIVNKIEFS